VKQNSGRKQQMHIQFRLRGHLTDSQHEGNNAVGPVKFAISPSCPSF
jgi:hypothetical protein